MAKGVKPEVETVLAELDAMLEALPVVATDPSATTSDLSDAFDGVNRSPAGSFGALLDGHDDDAFTSEEVDALLSSAAAGGDLTTAEDGASRAVLKSPVKTEKKRAVPYRRKRKRPKDELDYLRGKVDELQAELSALRQHDRFSPSEQLDDCDVDSMSERWRHIASHQKEEVGRSMDENARLRALLEGQLNVAKRLQDALEQVQNIAVRSREMCVDGEVLLLTECDGCFLGSTADRGERRDPNRETLPRAQHLRPGRVHRTQ